ncbi:MAG TPA: BatD family protein [Candidatus Limnocylindria bacterium]
MRILAAALFAILAVLGGAMPARAADPVNAAVTLDRASITVGDRIDLSVVVDAPGGYAVSDPTVARQIGDFEIVEDRASTKSTRPSGVRFTFRYVITAWRVGDHALPPIAIEYVAPDGSAGVARTDPVVVHVTSVITANDDPTNIKPLKPQLALPETTLLRIERIVLGVGGVVLATALAAVLFWYLLRRRSASPAEERLTPAQRALRDLNVLAEERLPEHGRTAEHYDRLATSVRRYVVERFGVEPGRTSREVRDALERAGLDRTQAGAIYEILHEADEVRFRHSTPYPAHAQNAVRSALEIVRRAASAEEYEIAALQPQ